jgi:serine/threonine protein kinase
VATCPECRVVFDDAVETCPQHGCELLPDDLFLPVDATLEPGTMVGEYRIQKKLGSGTFGDVYAGEHPLIGKRVAVKILNERFASDPVMISRFIAEARAVNKIRQRNIIDIFSFGVLAGQSRHYFVMELLDGLTLGELLDRKRRLPVSTVLPIVRSIAEALDAVHEAGITHRDLKPDNVFLAVERDGSYFPKLLDFGIAKLIGDEGAHRTGPGMVLGTPRYMSPEQARGKAADHRADIYALGVMIHEMLTGQAPFSGQSSVDVLLKHTAEPPPRLSEVCDDLPAELDAPVLAMLEKRPSDRPASAGKAVAALVERAKRVGLDRPGAPVAGSSSRDRTTLPAEEDPVWSNPTVVDGRAGDAEASPVVEQGGDHAHEASPRSSEATRQSPGNEPRARAGVAEEGAANGPSTEELSVIETDGARAKLGGSSRLKIGAALVGTLAVGISLWALGPRASSSALPESASSMSAAKASASSTSAAPSESAPVVSPASAAIAEPQVKPSDALPARVELRLSTRPAEVEVWLGDQKLGSSASPLSLVRGSERVELRLRRPGFKEETVIVTPDHDQVLDAALTPIAARPAPKPTPGKLDRILGDRE